MCSAALAQDQQPVPQQENPPSNPSPSQSPSQSPSDQPKDEKKDEAPNPAQAAAEKTVEVTVQAAQATKEMGKQALIAARNWESGWLTGIYVPAGQHPIPLSVKGRRDLYLEQTLATPGAYMKRMFAAGIDQARDSPPQWGEGWDAHTRSVSLRAKDNSSRRIAWRRSETRS